MFVKIPGKEQKQLLERAIASAGSERRLAKAIGIPNSMIYYYKKSFTRLPFERFERIVSFLGLSSSDFTFTLIDPATYRKMGGKAVFEKYKISGRFPEIHKKMREASSKKMTEWHKSMKLNSKEKYYKIQYERFKQVGGYKFSTKKGELVRNKLERDVADLLYDCNIDYKYEPYTESEKNVYFPDFAIGKTIIECTMWKGVHKAYQLSRKINDLENNGYSVFVVVPENLRKYYKPIQNKVLSIQELKEKLCPSSSDRALVLKR